MSATLDRQILYLIPFKFKKRYLRRECNQKPALFYSLSNLLILLGGGRTLGRRINLCGVFFITFRLIKTLLKYLMNNSKWLHWLNIISVQCKRLILDAYDKGIPSINA